MSEAIREGVYAQRWKILKQYGARDDDEPQQAAGRSMRGDSRSHYPVAALASTLKQQMIADLEIDVFQSLVKLLFASLFSDHPSHSLNT
jgi:hypothetical protein